MSWRSNATSSILCCWKTCSICCSNWIWFCSLKPCSNAVLFTPSQHDCEGQTDQPSSPLTSFRSLLIYQPPPPTKFGWSLPLGQLQLSFSCVTKKFLSSYPKNSSTSRLRLNFLFISVSQSLHVPACSCSSWGNPHINQWMIQMARGLHHHNRRAIQPVCCGSYQKKKKQELAQKLCMFWTLSDVNRPIVEHITNYPTRQINCFQVFETKNT